MNVLINQGHVKLADFGLSRKLNQMSSTSNVIKGIVSYIDPQWLRKPDALNKCDKRSDIYSVGILFWEITSGHPPFQKFDDDFLLALQIIDKKLREEPIDGTPIEFVKIYTGMVYLTKF
jgi:serine/threonine protein kinase